MPLGQTVGTGFVPIKPDTKGFGADLERGVTAEGKTAAKRAGDGIGRELSFAMRGAALAGVATLGKSVLDFAGFDKGMREVFTLLPDISKPAMDEMTDQVKSFAGEFGVLPTEVVPALYQSLSAGVPKDNVFTFLEDAQQLAKGGVTDLATAVDGLSGVVNAYGEEMGSAGAFSDMMFTTVKLGKTTIEDLSNNLFQVTPIASSLGVGFDQVSAAMAGLTLVTGNTSVASTQLKAMLAELGKSGSTAFDAFVEASGKTFPDFIREGGTLGEALGLMQTKAEENSLTLGDMFGSVEAGQAALVIAQGNAETFTANLEAMRNSSGATEEAFDTMNTGLSATMDRLKARFSVTLLDLGESLAPALESWGLMIADVLDAINMLPGPLRTGILLGGTLLAGIAGFAGPILKAVKLFGMMGKAMSALAMNPWMLAIGVLALTAYLIITNWEDVSDFFVAFGETMEEVWNGITDATVGWATDTFDTVTGTFDDIGRFLEDWWPYILGVFTGGIGLVVGLVIQNWDAIWSKTTEVFGAIGGFIGGVWTDVYNTTTRIGGDVVGFITSIPDKIAGAFTTLANTIKAPFETAFRAIKSTWNSTVGGFGFTVPGWIPKIGGDKFNIPKMALGGILTGPQLFIGGEYPGARTNPEIVAPQSMIRETVADAIGQGGPALEFHTHLHVDGNVDEATFGRLLERASVELARVVQRELDRADRGAGRTPIGSLAA